MPDQYRVRDPATDEVIANTRQVTIDDAVNRFARTANARFVDRGSDLLDEFTDFSIWDIDIKPVGSSTWTRRFSGFVVEQDYDKSETTAEFLSHDHWLKRRKVDREYTDADASDIVIDVVDDFTPLTVAPEDVEFVDEPTGITERFKGVTPAEIIGSLTESSASEQFGATNDLEFFLREFDAGEADLEFTPGRYRATDWEDDSRTQVNQVRVKYTSNGDKEVVVDDKAAQSALGESIGADSAVIVEESKTFEGITDEATARTRARSILNRAEPILIGEIETFNIGELRPGQRVSVVDPEAGVNEDFRIAEVATDSTGMDSAIVAENREGVVDTLASLSDEQDRIEARAGALDPDTTEFATLNFAFGYVWELTVREQTFADDRVIRMGWPEIRQRELVEEGGTYNTGTYGSGVYAARLWENTGEIDSVEIGEPIGYEYPLDADDTQPTPGGEIGDGLAGRVVVAEVD